MIKSKRMIKAWERVNEILNDAKQSQRGESGDDVKEVLEYIQTSVIPDEIDFWDTFPGYEHVEEDAECLCDECND